MLCPYGEMPIIRLDRYKKVWYLSDGIPVIQKVMERKLILNKSKVQTGQRWVDGGGRERYTDELVCWQCD
jgi:hypothetical protein